jgi:hypothetical protein
MARTETTSSFKGYGIMTNPDENSTRERGSTKNGSVVDPDGDVRSKTPRPIAEKIFQLERIGRRRLQKKLFIAKGRRDVA